MIVVMRMGAAKEEIDQVIKRIEDQGLKAHPIFGVERTVIGVVGSDRPMDPHTFEVLPGVERVMRVLHPFKLASREFHPHNTVFRLNGVSIGGEQLVIMAGPCSVESREQIMETAFAVKEAGASVLRGGAFKPRTSPYSFQGLGRKGLELLREAADAAGLLVVTEVMAPEDVKLVCEYADILQIGTRNMQNFPLLNAVGRSGHPVLLKRGMMSTLEEFLMAAEYILNHDNNRVILCERGIRTFETYTRNTLDINAVPALKQLSHLPVIVDPSQGTGKRDLVPAVSMGAIAAGADGLIIEVHPRPEDALSDGAQSLRPENFAELMENLRRLAPVVNRTL